MNVEFEFKDNKVLVKNEYGRTRTRDITYNIKEILETENNIEEIEDMVTKEKNNIKNSENNIKNKGIPNIYLGTVWLFLCGLNISSNNVFSIILRFLASVFYFSQGCFFVINPERKKIKISKKKIPVLQEELKIEKEKLNKLKKDKNHNSNALPYNSSSITISPSEQIKDLKNKLNIIRNYCINKKKYLSYYKKGILREKEFGYSDDEITIIEELIKREYPDLKVIENKKEKEKSIIKIKM